MAINIRRIAPGSRAVKDFIEVAYQIYRNDPAWIAPLKIDMSMRMDPKQNPFFEHAECQIFVAERDGELVGRVTAQVDHEHLKIHNDGVGFFGFIDTIDDPEVARALLDAAAAWLRERGMARMRGPMSLSINEEMGVLVEGFDTPPMVMMPHHLPYQGGLVEQAGLAKCKDVYAWHYTVGEVSARVRKAHADVKALPGFSVRELSTKSLDTDIPIVLDIFNDAWRENWGFVPATPAEAKKMASDMKLVLHPKLSLMVAIDGEPAAFALALPNLNEAIRDLDGKLFPAGLPIGLAKLLWRLKVEGTSSARLILLGIRKKFRHVKKYAGLSLYLYAEMNDRGRELGMKYGELSWTLEDNGPVNVGIKVMGGKIYKRYRVYERSL